MESRVVKIKLYDDEITKLERLVEEANKNRGDNAPWKFEEMASVILKLAIDDRIGRIKTL